MIGLQFTRAIIEVREFVFLIETLSIVCVKISKIWHVMPKFKIHLLKANKEFK